MGLLCVKSAVEQELWILFLKIRIGSDIIRSCEAVVLEAGYLFHAILETDRVLF